MLKYLVDWETKAAQARIKGPGTPRCTAARHTGSLGSMLNALTTSSTHPLRGSPAYIGVTPDPAFIRSGTSGMMLHQIRLWTGQVVKAHFAEQLLLKPWDFGFFCAAFVESVPVTVELHRQKREVLLFWSLRPCQAMEVAA